MQMKKLIAISLISFMLAFLAGCEKNIKGNGQPGTDTRTVDNFEKIRVIGNYQVTINSGDTQQVSVTADKNLLPYIKTKVEDKTLIIDTKRSIILSPTQPIQLNITMNQLRNIGIIGNGSVEALGLQGDEIDLKIIGSGSAKLAGKPEKVEIEVIGSGQVFANNLTAHTAEVKLEGTGNVAVYADQKLTVKISGAGKVQYFGEPRELEQKIAGTGEVIGIPNNAEKNSIENP